MLGKIALVFWSTVACLVAVEALLRLGGLGYGNAPLDGDAVLHHVHPSSYTFRVYDPRGEFGGHLVHYDAQRRRVGSSAPPSGEDPVVVFLGDSFVEGTQLPFDETFVGRVIERGVPAVNLGVSSYSPVLSYLQLRDALDTMDVRAVVHLLYANDSHNDQRYASLASLDAQGAIVAVPSEHDDWVVRQLRKLYLARLVRMSSIILREMITPEETVGVLRVADVDIDDGPLSPLTSEYLRRIATLLAERDIPYVVSCVPSKIQLNLKIHHELRFCEEAERFAEEQSMDYLDLRQYMVANAVEKPFFDRDIHFNAHGHELVANALWERLGALRQPARSGAEVSTGEDRSSVGRRAREGHELRDRPPPRRHLVADP